MRLKNSVFTHPLFSAVLALKILAGIFLGSYFLRDLFTPFVNYYVLSGFHNPWDFFLAQGNLKAFPYPPVMLWIFSGVWFLFSPLLSSHWQDVTFLHYFVMRIPLLASDLLIFWILKEWFRAKERVVLYLYWCSPIIFYVCYYHGQLDIVPTALLFLSLYLILKERLEWAAAVFGLAFATKSHLLVAVPFLFVYLYRTHQFREVLKFFLISFAIYFSVIFPHFSSAGYQALVLQAEEQRWVFDIAIHFEKFNLKIFVCPAILLVLFFRFSAYRKINWDLMMLYLGIAFCSFILLVPPMQGWYLWSIPFIIYFYCLDKAIARVLLILFSLSYLLFFLGKENSDLFNAWYLLSPKVSKWPPPFNWLTAHGIDATLWRNVVFTIMQTSLGSVIALMYVSGVRSNEIYKPRLRPIMIGISGDSGSGKDTFRSLIEKLLGGNNMICVNGDDYHKWPRGDENWEVMTPLNVRGNRLHDQLNQAVAIKEGEVVMNVEYDHQTGSFSRPKEINPKKFVFFIGLHSFYLERMRKLFNLKIFLDPDESLRQKWKIKRDTEERNYNPGEVKNSLERRQDDRELYILPQKSFAGLVIRVLPENNSLKLELEVENSYNLEALIEHLRRQPSLQIQWKTGGEGVSRQLISIEGDINSSVIEKIAFETIPNLREICVSSYQFENGINGLIQIFSLICLSHELRWRPAL